MYSFEELMSPVWDSEIIYDEFLTMVKSNGTAEAPLLFTPEEILSVTSADKTEVYEFGKDWKINGNVLTLTENSRAFAFDEKDLVFEEEKKGKSFPTIDGKYSLFHEGHFFHDRQISITYKKVSENVEYNTNFCGALLPRTMEKLRNKNDVTIVLYGDSISEGANCSGRALTTPFLPTWGSLTAESLRRYYKTKINMINTSKGGMDSYWAIENASDKVATYHPDLAIVAFGMNDRDETEQFVENIKKIKEIIIQSSPLTEFIVCATTTPNKRLKNFYKHQNEYLKGLKTMEEVGTAIADFNSMQKFLLERKRFIDLTGNNVNHPNDFMIRCHAHVLSRMLIPKSE